MARIDRRVRVDSRDSEFFASLLEWDEDRAGQLMHS